MTDAVAAPQTRKGRLELTLRALVLGCLLAVIFTAANTYLGLKVGLTFASAIPAAVISMAILRMFKTSTIWENMTVQTVASVGGAMSSIIFVLPGLVMVGWWLEFPFWESVLICVFGGVLGGLLFMAFLLKALLGRRAPAAGEHFYACGPAVMLDNFEKTCAALGHTQAHIERFTAVEVAAAVDAKKTFTVQLQRSGQTFEVTPETSLHKRLVELNIDVPWSCEEGICGSCETKVLEGVPDHRDMVLTDAERAANKAMMVCVSGCKSDRLVLDL